MSIGLSDNATERPDLELLNKSASSTTPVALDLSLRTNGYPAGLFVKYIAPDNPVHDWVVVASDGITANGLLWDMQTQDDVQRGSVNSWLAMRPATPALTAHRSGATTVTMFAGKLIAIFRNFEKVALTAAGTRTGGPAVYAVGQPLKVSENGLLCNDPDAFLLAATGGSAVVRAGTCNAAPSQTGGRVGADVFI
jgi:hypothetical protein